MPVKQKLPYGFKINSTGNVVLNESEANAIRLIFSEYLSGKSLGGICTALEQAGIPSPQGKLKWNRTSVDNILTRGNCLHGIIPLEQFCEAQYERQRRSNINEDTNKRKTTRYSSQNVLSGLLICGECGSSYRKITRSGGEVVWRCGNKVEHGSRICRSAPTISDMAVKDWLCEMLDMDAFDPCVVRERIDSIFVGHDSQLIVRFKQSHCASEEALLLAMV